MNTVNKKKVITRFPPSPTGGFHVGSARTALFNYLFTKQNDGMMYLRFEDTDIERSRKEYEVDITNTLSWLGIDYEGPFRQSERGEIYAKYINKLIEDGHAYVSDERGEGGKETGENVRDSVIRFKNTNTKVAFDDLIRGEISFDTTDLGDFVIAKSINEPLYHLAVVVDDHEMGVTHIIRGDDHISNTARQILIQKAIGASRPVYAHIPMILGSDKSKLSKRHGAKGVMEYKEDGILPVAMINYLAMLGWNPGTEQEFFTIEELISLFNINVVQKAGAIFSNEKLLWVNKHHISKMEPEDFIENVEKYIPAEIKGLPQYTKERLIKMTTTLKERISSFTEIESMSKEGELEFYFEAPEYFKESLVWHSKKLDEGHDHTEKESMSDLERHIKFIIESLEKIDENNFNSESVKSSLWDYAEKEGRGDVLWPIRFALSGRTKSPDPFTLSEIFGKKETLSRLNTALDKVVKT